MDELEAGPLVPAGGGLQKWKNGNAKGFDYGADCTALRISLNIPTVVEGVETLEDHEMIKELQCDFGQGYYYSRPISAEEFGRLIPAAGLRDDGCQRAWRYRVSSCSICRFRLSGLPFPISGEALPRQ